MITLRRSCHDDLGEIIIKELEVDMAKQIDLDKNLRQFIIDYVACLEPQVQTNLLIATTSNLENHDFMKENFHEVGNVTPTQKDQTYAFTLGRYLTYGDKYFGAVLKKDSMLSRVRQYIQENIPKLQRA